MKRFESKQQVVALKNAPANTAATKHLPYKKGKIYTVEAFMFCSNCGTQQIHIGLRYKPDPDFSNTNNFCDLCDDSQPDQGRDWAISTDFAPIDEIDNLLNSAIEEEDYELAAGLRDISKNLNQQ